VAGSPTTSASRTAGITSGALPVQRAQRLVIRHTLRVARGELTVRVLGPVQLIGVDGEVVDLPSPSQRRLLAALALHASRPVRAEWLCGVLDVTPGALRTSISRLRRSVGDGRLQTTIGGYRLDAPVDAMLACAEIHLGSGDPVALARALERWVGPALEEFADEPWAVGEARRLAAIRAAAVEDLAEALIVGHRAADALAVLEPHVIEHPWRDRPRGLILRALAASGRPTEALRCLQRRHGRSRVRKGDDQRRCHPARGDTRRAVVALTLTPTQAYRRTCRNHQD